MINNQLRTELRYLLTNHGYDIYSRVNGATLLNHIIQCIEDHDRTIAQNLKQETNNG
jgi:hypothetical protein